MAFFLIGTTGVSLVDTLDSHPTRSPRDSVIILMGEKQRGKKGQGSWSVVSINAGS